MKTSNQAGTHTRSFSGLDLVGEFGAKIGYYAKANHRIYLAYDYATGAEYSGNIRHELGSIQNELWYDSKSNNAMHKAIFGYDFLPQAIFSSSRLIFGFFVGYARINSKVDTKVSIISRANASHSFNNVEISPNSFKLSSDALLGGLNLGYLFDSVYGNFELSIKAEYVHSFKKSKNFLVTVPNLPQGNSKATFTLQMINVTLYAGYSYRF